MSFLSREPEVAKKVTNFYLLTWSILYAVLLFGIAPLFRLPSVAASTASLLISWSVILILRRKFDARIQESLDGGY